MKFHDASLFWAIPAVVAFCLIWYGWGARQRGRLIHKVVAPRLREALTGSVSRGRRVIKAALICLALGWLVVALARPQHGLQEVLVDRTGVDFLIALDVSRSMLAEDEFGTNRLAAAKEGILKLLNELTGDRVGLLIFAGDATLVAPLTRDHVAIERSLAAVEARSISERGSDLALAIRTANETLEAAEYATKVLVLVSDGEQLQGDAVLAARHAARERMRVFAVGVGSRVGTRLAEMQDGRKRYVQNEFGRDVVSRFDESALRQVASSGQGSYVRLGEERDGLLQIYRQGLAPLVKEKERRKLNDPREYFQWPLGIGIGLLLVELLLGDRRRRV